MSAQDSRPAARRRVPTLVASGVASLVLLVAVGMQAPAVSDGLRWKPSPSWATGPRIEFSGRLIIGLGGSGWRAFNTLWWLGWVLAGVIGLILLALVVRWLRRLIQPARTITSNVMGADTGAPSRPDVQIVQSGLAAALGALSTERVPGNAIVRAWQGLQDAAAAAGLDRRPAETTSEFTARLLYRSRASAEPIHMLQSLYHQVRFGHHSPDVDEISAARDALAALVDLWKQDLPQ